MRDRNRTSMYTSAVIIMPDGNTASFTVGKDGIINIDFNTHAVRVSYEDRAFIEFPWARVHSVENSRPR